MNMLPKGHPAKTLNEVLQLMKDHGCNESICVVGVRGYYKDSMGVAGKNDVGIYDDAIFVVAPENFTSFNANVDPSRHRAGHGTGAAKGMANLKPGLYHAHQLGLHRGKYMALIQTAAPVTVVRDGNPPYEDTGYFGINIHHGSYNSTSSAGCQTIHPDQWASFISIVQKVMHAHKMSVMPYLLVAA